MTDDLVKRLHNRRESRYDSKTQGAEWHEDELCQEAAARISALEAENKRLRNEITSCKMLTPNDLKAVDKHCDWVAFKHAWNGVWNSRAKNEKPRATVRLAGQS